VTLGWQFALDFAQCYNAQQHGAWRSLVARFNGVEEVVGSNPAAPTGGEMTPRYYSRRFLLELGVSAMIVLVKEFARR
jgi:hypothetical protein